MPLLVMVSLLVRVPLLVRVILGLMRRIVPVPMSSVTLGSIAVFDEMVIVPAPVIVALLVIVVASTG